MRIFLICMCVAFVISTLSLLTGCAEVEQSEKSIETTQENIKPVIVSLYFTQFHLRRQTIGVYYIDGVPRAQQMFGARECGADLSPNVRYTMRMYAINNKLQPTRDLCEFNAYRIVTANSQN